MQSLKVKHETKNGWELFSYVGHIDDAASLHFVTLGDSIGRRVRFNLRQITAVNSRGIAAWMNFIRYFREGREIVLEQCSEQFVMQLNMIPSLTIGVTIDSVMATMICNTCQKTTSKVVHIIDGQPKQQDLQSRSSCDACREPMALADNPDDYFAFAKIDPLR